MNNTDRTPAGLGYRWPAEWEPHAATWLAWPHNVNTWPGTFERIPTRFADFARTVADFEAVHVLAGGAAVRACAERQIGSHPNITLHDVPTNDAWCRDHGPTFLTPSYSETQPGVAPSPPTQVVGQAARNAAASTVALVDWKYNAWGGKYPPFEFDDAVPARIAELLDCPRFAAAFVLEGGAIEGNGHGTLLTTASCVLHPQRNPGWQRRDVERLLGDYLGARHVLWLARGELSGDDTDGHIDQLARFVGPRTIVAATATNPEDQDAGALRENLAQLRSMKDQDGQSLDVVSLPLPEPKFHDGHRLPASYCNFCFVNGGVIVPQFDDPADSQAIAILAELLPDRTVIGLPALDLVWGLGAFHCLSQQQPAYLSSRLPA